MELKSILQRSITDASRSEMQVNNLEGKRSRQLIANYIKIIIPMSSSKILDFLKTYLVICFHGETFREPKLQFTFHLPVHNRQLFTGRRPAEMNVSLDLVINLCRRS